MKIYEGCIIINLEKKKIHSSTMAFNFNKNHAMLTANKIIFIHISRASGQCGPSSFNRQ